MTDPNTAQATALIAALQDRVSEMVAKLARAEDSASIGRPEQDWSIHVDAAQLRHDIHHAQFLIARMRQRFPAAEIAGPTPAEDLE